MTQSKTAPPRKIAAADPSTPRFEKKREAILAAATDLMNHRGLHGMTLTAVAAEVGLITNSVTYYFKKKEDLAVACFLEGIARYRAMLEEAMNEADPPARMRKFINLCLENVRGMRRGEVAPLPVFSDVRALPDEPRKPVGAAYREYFLIARELFAGAGYEWMSEDDRTVRALLLLENIYWWWGWLDYYDNEDLDRVGERTFELLAYGLAPSSAAWTPTPLKFQPHHPSDDKQARARETYLLVATKLLNWSGYRGVSVKNISAALNLTKGAFYHHHDTKDEVIVACFERTFETMGRVQHASVAQTNDAWQALSSAAAALVDYQLSEEGPLLRFSALSALPEDIRETMVDQAFRVSQRFSSMIADGVTSGAVRPVDPSIAAQMINGALNASAELPFWVENLDTDEAARLFARPMLMGMFNRPPAHRR